MNLPIHLQNRQRRELAAQAMGGISAGAGPHISIKDNRFTLVDAAGNEKPMQTLFLDVCIIDANPVISKIFYDPNKKYDPTGADNAAPICFSDNGIGASAQSSQPQNTSCQLCPHNAWGSAISQMTGRQTKACNDGKKLAVLVPNQGVDGMTFLLRVPPATLKNLAKYTQTVGGHGVDLPDVITRLEFESQGVLKFTPTGYVDEPTAHMADKIWAEKGTDQMVGRLDRPWNGAADAQKVAYSQTQQQLAPPPVQPAPLAPAAPPVAPPAFMSPPQPGGFGAPPPAPFANRQFGQPSPTPGPASNFGGQQTAPANSPFGNGQPPSTATEPPKVRKPRAPKVPPPAPQVDDGIPPFLRNQSNDAGPPPAPEPPAQQFGMNAAPPTPNAGMQEVLDVAFRLPT